MIGGPITTSCIFGRRGGEEGKIMERQYAWIFIDEIALLVQKLNQKLIVW